MEIISAVSAGKTLFELARALQSGLAKGQIKVEEVPARLMELQQLILDTQATMHELADENRALRAQLEDASEVKEIKKALVVVEHVYFKRKDNGKLDGPFCTICWDDQSKLIRMKYENEGNFGVHGDNRKQFRCVIHDTKHFIHVSAFNNVEPG